MPLYTAHLPWRAPCPFAARLPILCCAALSHGKRQIMVDYRTRAQHNDHGRRAFVICQQRDGRVE